jgi:hypothetical protein
MRRVANLVFIARLNASLLFAATNTAVFTLHRVIIDSKLDHSRGRSMDDAWTTISAIRALVAPFSAMCFLSGRGSRSRRPAPFPRFQAQS